MSSCPEYFIVTLLLWAQKTGHYDRLYPTGEVMTGRLCGKLQSQHTRRMDGASVM